MVRDERDESFELSSLHYRRPPKRKETCREPLSIVGDSVGMRPFMTLPVVLSLGVPTHRVTFLGRPVCNLGASHSVFLLPTRQPFETSKIYHPELDDLFTRVKLLWISERRTLSVRWQSCVEVGSEETVRECNVSLLIVSGSDWRRFTQR